jgi:hypothetical protein
MADAITVYLSTTLADIALIRVAQPSLRSRLEVKARFWHILAPQ